MVVRLVEGEQLEEGLGPLEEQLEEQVEGQGVVRLLEAVGPLEG